MKLRIFALLLGGLFCCRSLSAMKSIEIEKDGKMSEFNDKLNYVELAECVKKCLEEVSTHPTVCYGDNSPTPWTDEEIEGVYRMMITFDEDSPEDLKDKLFEEERLPRYFSERARDDIRLSDSKEGQLWSCLRGYLAPLFERKKALGRRNDHGVGIKRLGKYWHQRVREFGGSEEAADKLEELIWRYGVTDIQYNAQIRGAFVYPYSEWLQFIKEADADLFEKITTLVSGFVPRKSAFRVDGQKVVFYESTTRKHYYLDAEGSVVNEKDQPEAPQYLADQKQQTMYEVLNTVIHGSEQDQEKAKELFGVLPK